jgi:hypothetical protein
MRAGVISPIETGAFFSGVENTHSNHIFPFLICGPMKSFAQRIKVTDAGLSGDRFLPARCCPAFGPPIGSARSSRSASHPDDG